MKMEVIEKSNLVRIMQYLEEKIICGEGLEYYVPDLWNCFGYKGSELIVRERGLLAVNPYSFFYSCIKEYIMGKAKQEIDYSKTINNLEINKKSQANYIGGDWIKKTSVYAMNISLSTSWNHSDLEIEKGSFLKAIALLPLLKKMGISAIVMETFYVFDQEKLVINETLKDRLLKNDFGLEEQLTAFVEACHILDIKVLTEILPNSSKVENYVKLQKLFGFDGAKINKIHTISEELEANVIKALKAGNDEFAIIAEEFSTELAEASRKKGYNIIVGSSWIYEPDVEGYKTHEFVYNAAEKAVAVFACSETSETEKIASKEQGKLLSKFLAIFNNFVPNTVPYINSGVEVYNEKIDTQISWDNADRWDMPDTLEAVKDIRNKYINTITNKENYLPVKFESPRTKAIGVCYIIDNARWTSYGNLLLIIANTDLYNEKEYTVFLENIRYESGNSSKKAWLMYSPCEWSHDIYDFDHQQNLELKFKPGEVKILIM